MEYTKGNAALLKSKQFGTPVRVVRGSVKKKHLTTAWAFEEGYRYDG
jgi:hypothetical protein